MFLIDDGRSIERAANGKIDCRWRGDLDADVVQWMSYVKEKSATVLPSVIKIMTAISESTFLWQRCHPVKANPIQ